MKVRQAPRLALAVMRHFVAGPYKESLEGDLLEEFAAGRSVFWLWRQLMWALYERACFIARQQAATFLVATLFFFVALWAVAPATYSVMGWAREVEPLSTLVLLVWLSGVPFVLGGIAGVAERRNRIGAILLGAGVAYLAPVTLPFTFAACDLCNKPFDTTIPRAVQLLTPFCSAMFAGLGAWIVGKHLPAPSKRRLS